MSYSPAGAGPLPKTYPTLIKQFPNNLCCNSGSELHIRNLHAFRSRGGLMRTLFLRVVVVLWLVSQR
jgi:hypothetical protein